VGLHTLALVGGQTAGPRERRGLEHFAALYVDEAAEGEDRRVAGVIAPLFHAAGMAAYFRAFSGATVNVRSMEVRCMYAGALTSKRDEPSSAWDEPGSSPTGARASAGRQSSVAPSFTRTCQWAIFPSSMCPLVSRSSNQRRFFSSIAAFATAFFTASSMLVCDDPTSSIIL
jgi:hypothetical protein